MGNPSKSASRRVVALCVALLAAAGPAVAAADEPPRPRAVTLDEAIAYARAHQPLLDVARARFAAVQAQAAVADAQWSPTVQAFGEVVGASVNNSTSTVINQPRVDLPRIGATPVRNEPSLRPYASSMVAIGARQQLYDFGRIAAQRGAAEAAAEIERRRRDGAVLDVELAVTEAFLTVLAAHAIVDASRGALDRATAHRDHAKAGVDRGMRPPIELTRAEADLARFDVARLRAEGSLAVAQSMLAAAVGAPDALLDASGSSPTAPALPPLAETLDQALSRDSSLLEAAARIDAQRAETRAIGALSRPDLFVTGAVSARGGGAQPSSGQPTRGGGWAPLVPNWDIGLVLSIPLFDPAVRARRDASRVTEEVRVAESRVLAQRVAVAVRQAHLAGELADGAVVALTRAVDAAVANETQAATRFRAGLATAVEVADAESLRADAEIQLAIGKFQVARSRALLARAAGGR